MQAKKTKSLSAATLAVPLFKATMHATPIDGVEQKKRMIPIQ
jgi:hypothetical protein